MRKFDTGCVTSELIIPFKTQTDPLLLYILLPEICKCLRVQLQPLKVKTEN